MSNRFSLLALAGALVLGGAFAGCLDDAPEEGPAETVPQATNQTANVTVDDGLAPMPEDIGHQPHMHDYWTGRERVTLMDDDVSSDPFTTAFFTFFNVVGAQTPGVGGTMVELPEGAIVYEGTGQLEMTVSWTDPTVTGMMVRYRSAASPDFSEPQAITKDATLAIDVTPEMSDMPHEKTSRWMFIFSAGAGQAVAGTFHVKVDIVKMRDIEQFPGHPELFGGANTLVLFDGPAQSSQSGPATRLVQIASGGFTAQEGVPSAAVVPMETMSMTANVTITSATASVGKVTGAMFLYKPANTNRFMRANVLASNPDTGVYQFAWPVEMSETDSPYAESSQWAFDLRVTTDPTGLGNQQCGGCSDAQVDYTLTVVAYDAAVEGAEREEDEDDDGDR
jgi:hypothetical protein